MAASAAASPRVYVGVLDDEALRWGAGRPAAWRQLEASHASVVRTMVDWSHVASTRPRNPRNPFDRAYHFGDVDQLVADANRRGIEVLLTLWGTPGWANGHRKKNVPPRLAADFGAFAQAVATRYSGAYGPYLGFVRFISIWNEPNTRRFLRAPNPAQAYAALVRAGYRGVKAGSPKTLVGAGETAASHCPAWFVSAVARADPTLPFDAWAHHPYPASAGGAPDDHESWPDVGLTSLARFDAHISRAFHRARTPLWVSEYAESRTAVPAARIAEDVQRAVQLAHRVPAVTMFVWFMLQNHHDEPWQSGLVGSSAFRSFRATASALDPRIGNLVWRPRDRPLVVYVPARELQLAEVPLVAVTYRLTGCNSEVTRTDDKAMLRGASVRVVVMPGDVQPITLVVTFRNAAGQTFLRTYRFAGAPACAR